MKKDMLFEAICVLLLIFLAFVLYVMVASGGPAASEEWNLSGMVIGTSSHYYCNMYMGSDGTLYTIDGKNVYAINQDGQVRWSLEIPYLISEYRSIQAWGEPVWLGNGHASDNGTVYIQLFPSDSMRAQELIAISPDGKLLWGTSYRDDLPYDLDARNGILYLKFNNHVDVINADGVESRLTAANTPPGLFNTSASDYGLTFDYKHVMAINASDYHYRHYNTATSILSDDILPNINKIFGNRTLDQIDTIIISANDTRAGKAIWNYTLPVEKHTVTVNASNYKALMIDYDDIEQDNRVSPEEWYRSNNVTFGIKANNSWADVRLVPTRDVLYVSYWTYTYEVPTFFNQSNCTYAGGIYAIDNGGELLWYKPTDSRIIAMQANNGTVYYGTENGRVSSARVDAAAGFALSALFYLFIRFFLAGAVTRARGLVGKNVNRNRVLTFIAANPGASMYEISTRLGMNMGTARYHLMILELNHRIVSYRADDKYVRYFTNAGSYSEEQQLVISLMRRGGINRVLGKLLEKPGLSNLELANELGVQDSSTMRQMKELVAKGVVVKEQTTDGKLAYSVKNEYKEQIALAIERFNRFNAL